MKKVILIALAAILLISGALTAYVANLDWNTYKNEIASRFSNTLGKKIEFGGNLSVSIFPKPHISVRNVSILNPETNEKLANIQNVEAALSLKALLDGTPEIETMSLIGTEVWYKVEENGDSNWHQGSKGRFLDTGIDYHRQTISVQNALVHYENKKYEIVREFEQINADIVAESFTGPYRIDGNFVNSGDHYGFAVGLGDIGQTDDVFLNFAITHPRSNSYILYDGNYNFANSHFEGNFSGEFQQPATLINIVLGQEILPDMLNLPFIFSVHLKSDTAALQMTSLALKYSEIIEGSGNVIIPWKAENGAKPTIDVQYQFANIDIRPLLNGALMLFEAYRQEKMPYEPETDYDVHYDLAMQRMVIGDTADSILENVSLKGSWVNDDLNLDEYYAACPGNVVWTMSGSLLKENAEPTLFIKSRVEGKNFAAFMRAFGVELSAPSQSSYRNVDATFNVAGTPIDFVVSDLKMALDKSQIEGSLKVNFADEKPQYQLTADINTLNFDNYTEAADENDDLSTKIKKDLARFAALKGADWQFETFVTTAIFRGVPLKNLTLKFTNDGDAINISDLTIDDVLGTHLSLVANISGVGEENLNFSGFEYNIKTPDIFPIITKLGLTLPQLNIFKNKPMQAEGIINGTMNEAEVETNVTVNKTQFYYKGKIVNGENFEFDGKSELKTTNFGGLVNDFGGHWEKLKANSAFNCSGEVAGSVHDWSLKTPECVLGKAKYSGNIEVRQEEDMWFAKGKVNTTEFDAGTVVEVQIAKDDAAGGLAYIDDFINKPKFSKNVYNYKAYAPVVLDLAITADRVVYDQTVLQNVSTHLKNEQNQLSFENLNFEYGGATYNGEIVIDYTDKPHIYGKGSGKNIALKNIGGKIYKITSGEATIEGEFSSSAASEDDFVRELSGNMDFSVQNFGVDGLDFEAVAQDLYNRAYSTGVFQMVRDNLQRGHTDFDNFIGKIEMKKGVWNFVNSELRNDVVALEMSGEDNLNEWRMHNEFKAKLQKLDLPGFSFIFSGPINKPAIDINVEKLAEQYDAYWAEVEYQKQVNKDMQKKELKGEMDKTQQEVINLQARTKNLSAVFEKYIKNGVENQYKTWYEQQITRLGVISNQADEMKEVAKKPEFTEDDVVQIQTRCRKYQEEMDEIEKQSQEQYRQDLLSQLQAEREIAQVYKKENSSIYSEYQTELQEKFSELAKYGETQDFTNNEALRKMQLQLEETRNKFWEMGYKVNDDLMQNEDVLTTPELEKKLTETRLKLKNLQEYSDNMKNMSDGMFAHINAIIAERKAISDAEEAAKKAEKEAEKEARQKKYEEAKEMVAKKNEAIKAAKKAQEEAAKKAKIIQPTEAESQSGKAQGIIIKSYEEPIVYVPQPTGLLKPLDDGQTEAKPVSGTLTVK